jgi:hypothetical protein
LPFGPRSSIESSHTHLIRSIVFSPLPNPVRRSLIPDIHIGHFPNCNSEILGQIRQTSEELGSQLGLDLRKVVSSSQPFGGATGFDFRLLRDSDHSQPSAVFHAQDLTGCTCPWHQLSPSPARLPSTRKRALLSVFRPHHCMCACPFSLFIRSLASLHLKSHLCAYLVQGPPPRFTSLSSPTPSGPAVCSAYDSYPFTPLTTSLTACHLLP